MIFPDLRGLPLHRVLIRTVKEFVEDEMSTYASALAYQMLFSLFPFLLFLIALIGFLHLPDFFSWLRMQSELVLPPQALDQVNPVIDQLQQSKGGLLSVGIVIALWTASAGVRLMMSAMNAAYDVDEGRPIWKRLPLSIFYTVGIAGMLLAAAALMVLGPQVMSWLAGQIGMEEFVVTLWTILRWPVIVLLLMFAVALMYYVMPDVKQKFVFITPGSVLAVVVWIIASLGFGYYVKTLCRLQRDVWQYRRDHRVAPVFLYLGGGAAAGRGNECGDRAHVVRRQEYPARRISTGRTTGRRSMASAASTLSNRLLTKPDHDP